MSDAEDSGEEVPEGAQRTLSQAEIDSLLNAGAPPISGMERIVNSGLVSYERLPMLEIVFDRLVRILSTSLRNFTSDNVEVTMDGVASLRLGDYLVGIPEHAMLVVFHAAEWDNAGLLMIDGPMIYSIVDLLLGGRRGQSPTRFDLRSFTSIERALIEKLARLVLADFALSFAPICPVVFHFERLETNPRFAAIARLSNAAILARLKVEMEGRGGRIEMLLPYATMEPVRDLLLQQFMGEKFGRDTIWESHLADELWNTEISLEAVLDEQVMRLSDIMSLAPGDALPLAVRTAAPLRLRCGGVPMFEARLGQKHARLAVTIVGPVSGPARRGAS